jgi:hypothetical protein
MGHDVASEKLFAEAASRQAAKIGVIASPFLAAARPNPNRESLEISDANASI